jgi:hypothetical protein
MVLRSACGSSESAGRGAHQWSIALGNVHVFVAQARSRFYEMSLRSVRDRRDFRDEYLHRIATLIVYVDDAEALATIDREIQVSAEARKGETLRETAEETVAVKARKIDAEGFTLLAPSVPLSFETLKTAYRRAAKRYHPDVGGDTVPREPWLRPGVPVRSPHRHRARGPELRARALRRHAELPQAWRLRRHADWTKRVSRTASSGTTRALVPSSGMYSGRATNGACASVPALRSRSCLPPERTPRF